MPPQEPYLRSSSGVPQLSRIWISYCPIRYTPEFDPTGTQNSTWSSQLPCSSTVWRSAVRPSSPFTMIPVPVSTANRRPSAGSSRTAPATRQAWSRLAVHPPRLVPSNNCVHAPMAPPQSAFRAPGRPPTASVCYRVSAPREARLVEQPAGGPAHDLPRPHVAAGGRWRPVDLDEVDGNRCAPGGLVERYDLGAPQRELLGRRKSAVD